MMDTGIYGQEFLGRTLEVVESTNASLKTIRGAILKETKNTFHVKTQQKEVVVPKSQCTFRIHYGQGTFTLMGKLICMRPENRLKELNKIKKIIKRME